MRLKQVAVAVVAATVMAGCTSGGSGPGKDATAGTVKTDRGDYMVPAPSPLPRESALRALGPQWVSTTPVDAIGVVQAMSCNAYSGALPVEAKHRTVAGRYQLKMKFVGPADVSGFTARFSAACSPFKAVVVDGDGPSSTVTLKARWPAKPKAAAYGGGWVTRGVALASVGDILTGCGAEGLPAAGSVLVRQKGDPVARYQFTLEFGSADDAAAYADDATFGCLDGWKVDAGHPDGRAVMVDAVRVDKDAEALVG